MSNQTITFAIVSHGQRTLIQTLLNNLNSLAQELDFQVVLIDNLPPPPNPMYGDHLFQITYHRNDYPLGLSENVNKAFNLAGRTSKYFCILNPDVLFDQNIFPVIIDEMENHQIHIISPLVVDKDLTIQDSFRQTPTPKSLLFRNLSTKKDNLVFEELPNVIYPDWIAGLFMFMTSEVFEKVGGFNTDYKLYFEDVDFCLRAKQSGYKTGVIKSVKIIHDAQRSSHKNFRYLLMHIRSAIRFFTSQTYKWFQRNHSSDFEEKF
jgi:GT2 family glycosyltransferase